MYFFGEVQVLCSVLWSSVIPFGCVRARLSLWGLAFWWALPFFPLVFVAGSCGVGFLGFLSLPVLCVFLVGLCYIVTLAALPLGFTPLTRPAWQVSIFHSGRYFYFSIYSLWI